MVWIATTVFRVDPPRWDEGGSPILETIIDGVANNPDTAKRYALQCSAEPVRWFKAKEYADWIGGHKNEGDGDSHPFHFHMASEWPIDDALDDIGRRVDHGQFR